MSDGSLSKPRSPDSASGVSADRTVDSIIRRLTNPPVHSQSPFRFLDLPAEIRLMILEQAGLNPTDEIRWSPGNCLCRECLCDQVFSDDMIHTTSTCPLGERTLRTVWHGYCCGECEIPNADNRSDLCYCVKFGYRRSSRCRCAHVPALFLVNRQISADAMSLYYSRKRHIVYPPHYRSLQYCSNAHYCGQDADYSITKTELSLYLSAITRSALHRLTSLEWIVPYWAPTRLATRKSIYECHGWLVPESVTKIYWHDYLDTVDMMEHAMDLQNLTLIFNCSWVWQVWPAQNFLQNKEQPGREHCLNLVYPIRKLASAGLANFRVRSRSPRFQSDICTALESEMECLVMSAKYDTVTDIN